MQLTCYLHKGNVQSHSKREYGKAEIEIDINDDLLNGFLVNSKIQVWMSHGDRIEALPDGFETIAHTDNSPYAAMRNKEKNIYGVQFHPEVVHTPQGQ